jgi:hypothetical protein
VGSHAVILLFLLLYVPAVILSEAKDPEDLGLPPLSGPFHPKISTLRFILQPTPSNRHFDRGRSRFLRAAERRHLLLYLDSRLLFICSSIIFPHFPPKNRMSSPKST